MAVMLVTYDLKKAGQNYRAVYDYLRTFTYCKGMESVWLIDTEHSVSSVRDRLGQLVDGNDVLFVVRLQRDWAALNYGCADWLNESQRNW
jgi:hypothetical protein